MELPPLTYCICTYKRPWYAVMTIQQIIGNCGYGGPIRFHIADGGSPQEDIDYYKFLLKEYPTTVSVTNNLSDMVNSCAHHSEELWVVALDDFMPNRSMNLIPDALILLKHPEIGAVRMGRMAFWGNGEGETGEYGIYADIIGTGGLHWWRLDKQRSVKPYMCTIGFTLYHRRFWDAYGDIPPCEPKNPGQAELLGNERFQNKEGPTIAVPMRFGEDCGEWKEPIWHMGTWRSDNYASTAHSRF